MKMFYVFILQISTLTGILPYRAVLCTIVSVLGIESSTPGSVQMTHYASRNKMFVLLHLTTSHDVQMVEILEMLLAQKNFVPQLALSNVLLILTVVMVM